MENIRVVDGSEFLQRFQRRSVLFKERLVHFPFENGQRIMNERFRSLYGRSSSASVWSYMRRKKGEEIEREKEKSTRTGWSVGGWKGGQPIGTTIFALVKRSRRSGTDSPFEPRRFFAESGFVLFFLFFSFSFLPAFRDSRVSSLLRA